MQSVRIATCQESRAQKDRDKSKELQRSQLSTGLDMTEIRLHVCQILLLPSGPVASSPATVAVELRAHNSYAPTKSEALQCSDGTKRSYDTAALVQALVE